MIIQWPHGHGGLQQHFGADTAVVDKCCQYFFFSFSFIFEKTPFISLEPAIFIKYLLTFKISYLSVLKFSFLSLCPFRIKNHNEMLILPLTLKLKSHHFENDLILESGVKLVL
jgi:hypothetical protein